MKSELRIRPKRSFNPDVCHTIRLFLSDWLSDICQNDYTIEEVASYGNWKITFDSSEDAVIVKLTDLPGEFSDHIDLN